MWMASGSRASRPETNNRVVSLLRAESPAAASHITSSKCIKLLPPDQSLAPETSYIIVVTFDSSIISKKCSLSISSLQTPRPPASPAVSEGLLRLGRAASTAARVLPGGTPLAYRRLRLHYLGCLSLLGLCATTRRCSVGRRGDRAKPAEGTTRDYFRMAKSTYSLRGFRTTSLSSCLAFITARMCARDFGEVIPISLNHTRVLVSRNQSHNNSSNLPYRKCSGMRHEQPADHAWIRLFVHMGWGFAQWDLLNNVPGNRFVVGSYIRSCSVIPAFTILSTVVSPRCVNDCRIWTGCQLKSSREVGKILRYEGAWSHLANLLGLLLKLDLAGSLLGLALELCEAVNTSNLSFSGTRSSGGLCMYLPPRVLLLCAMHGHRSIQCGFIKRPGNSQKLSTWEAQVRSCVRAEARFEPAIELRQAALGRLARLRVTSAEAID